MAHPHKKLLVGISVVLIALGGFLAVDASFANPGLEVVRVIPRDVTVPRGGQVDFQAIAEYTDGTTGNLTQDTFWVSLNESIAWIDHQTGRATGISEGTIDIAATPNYEIDSATLPDPVRRYVGHITVVGYLEAPEGSGQ